MKKKKNIKIDRKKEFKNRILLRKRLIKFGILFTLILFIIIFRIGYVQFAKGNEYKEKAYNQQTINRIISPKRGTIYDSTQKPLAISADVDTVTINPGSIIVKDMDPEVAAKKTKELKELVAHAFSDIFELEYEEVLTKVNSTSSIETIIKKVEQDKINKLKEWMKENKVYAGINIDEDTKRYYPYGTLAANLIGFCGNDNQGLEGLESRLDKILTGTPGKIVTSGDSIQQEIPDTNQLYIAAENGSDVVLSIDYTIQSIAEKYLKQAVEENNCSRGGNVIMMDPDTGDILAMATYPTYDLNSPFTPNTEEAQKLTGTERSNYLYKMWRNIAVTDGYEPGSTFKILTAAIALEENIIDADNEKDFVCTGKEKIAGSTTIKCWRHYNPHGYQSLRMALGNSCNPAFIQLGNKIGARTFYKYLDAFGLFNTTGAEVSGESSSYFHAEKNVGPVELATLSFGQRFTITPLQLITAVSSIANDGILMKPRIVKQVINSDTGAITNIEPVSVRQVLSVETCNKMKDLLESVVTTGTGKYAAVEGYSIGGKTGTSEPNPARPDEGYVASYLAISPILDTKVVILVTLYDPKGYSHEGGQIAAPVVSQIMSEVLPYLGIVSDKEAEVSSESNILQDIRNKTVTEAVKILNNAGFRTKVSTSENKNEVIVTDQVPKPGVNLAEDSIICLYTKESDARTSVTVPDLKGCTLAEARKKLKAKNLNLSYEGYGKVISQDIIAGSSVEEGTVIKIILKDQISDVH